MTTVLAPTPAVTSPSYAESYDPALFKRVRTRWLLFALLLQVDGGGIFTISASQGKDLLKIKQYYDVASPLRTLATIALWSVIALLIMSNFGATVQQAFRQPLVLLLTCFSFLSLLWSQDTVLTVKGGINLLLVSSFAWYFACGYRAVDQMRVLVAAGYITAMCSLAMVVLLPEYGLDLNGHWKGVFGQKNQFGHALLFLFAGILFRPVSSNRWKRVLLLQATLPLGMIVMTGSKGTLLLTALMVAVRFVGPLIKNSKRERLPFVLFGVAAALFGVVFGQDVIFALLGRDGTLSGRTKEWSVLSFYASRHPWLGYGYQAFWTGQGDALYAMKAVGGAMRGADSGYLDTMLQLGFIGIILWMMLTLVAVMEFLTISRGKSVPLAAYWYAAIILTTVMGSYTDTFFPVAGGVHCFICVLACAGLNNIRNEAMHSRLP